MQRRNVLKGVAAVAVLAPLGPAKAAPFRRLRPGDPGWPTAQEWESLKAQLGGNLIKPTDLYSACATDATGSDCADARERNRQSSFFIGDQSGGTQVSGWLERLVTETQQLMRGRRAQAGGVMVAAVNFARAHPGCAWRSRAAAIPIREHPTQPDSAC